MEIVAVPRKGKQLRASYTTLQVPPMLGGRNHVLLATQVSLPKYSAAAETDRRELLLSRSIARSVRHRSTFAPRIGKEVLVDGRGTGAKPAAALA
ncbi:hypothetical protein [Allomesorhizobium alhagi]|uniref:hypothetical protein n=1 Tax=Allomesorhizobium alhagi TaxID=475067 RepID=UPI001300C630|nr:hypothetical protein [Mesorhizobium alhagi]